ncbi:MAG TPA: DUF4147 domain-containing protein [Balneolales bacterium]|nr:DUF4147 domain-containing protein [Balneolales bacterium]
MDEIFEKQKSDALSLFHTALEQMHPRRLIRDKVKLTGHVLTVCDREFIIPERSRIWVAGSGKAAGEMAAALSEILGKNIEDGLIICPHKTNFRDRRIQAFETSHPLPDIDSVTAGYEMRDFARSIPDGDTLIYVMSGGSSALMCIPEGDLEIEDITETNRLLLECGADIHEINTIRKHLSGIKGGKLAERMNRIHLINLIISDVTGNNLADIGSGPTVPDDTPCSKAIQILKYYNIWEKVPKPVYEHLRRKNIVESKAGYTRRPIKARIDSFLLASAEHLADQTVRLAKEKGYNPWFSGEVYQGNVRHVARDISSTAIQVLSKNKPVEKPAALIFVGESTVQLTGEGLGGRNQELALTAAISIEGQHHITVLSAGTDGRDGPTDAAGAICTSNTALLARKKEVEPEKYLQNNDSYHFFEQLDGLLKTGATGNNLMDLQIVLVNK